MSLIFNIHVSVGASGAIFGLAGYFIGMIIFMNKNLRDYIDYHTFLSTFMFIIYNIINGFTTKGIDNFAHLGGLVTGFCLALIIKPANEPGKIKMNRFLVISIIIYLK